MVYHPLSSPAIKFMKSLNDSWQKKEIIFSMTLKIFVLKWREWLMALHAILDGKTQAKSKIERNYCNRLLLRMWHFLRTPPCTDEFSLVFSGWISGSFSQLFMSGSVCCFVWCFYGALQSPWAPAMLQAGIMAAEFPQTAQNYTGLHCMFLQKFFLAQLFPRTLVSFTVFYVSPYHWNASPEAIKSLGFQ